MVSKLMSGLNPDLNHIRAFKVSIKNYGPDIKAADKTCKNLARKVLAGSHEETFIVVDNENLKPQNWISYYSMANETCVNAVAVGLDIYDENINNDEFSSKIYLQRTNCDMFIASMYKYWCIKNESDMETALSDLLTLLKE